MRFFELKLLEGLEDIDEKHIPEFAWRCAVRTLPFISNRWLWKESELQKKLYTVFYLLDLAIGSKYTTKDTREKAMDAAIDAIVDGYSIYDSSASINTVIDAAMLAISAIDDTRGIRTEARVVALYASRSASSLYKMNIEKFEYEILRDLQTIQQGVKRVKVFHPKEYGGTDGILWKLFQESLEAKGCGYWGKLYQQIFDNRLVLDQEALERRLSIPKEIQEQGAAVAGKYLEELEK